MLSIVIKETELVDNTKLEFIQIKGQRLILEHSLVSLAKWEAKWHRPFLSQPPITEEELIDYIRCMTITQNVNPLVYQVLSPENYQTIREYMDDPMTATTINRRNSKPNREIITAEVIYYWIIALNIPFECQRWHLNRLLTLIDVVSLKSNPEKMSKGEILARNKKLNSERKKRLGTKG